MKKHVYFLFIAIITLSSAKAIDIESAGIRAGFGGEISARFPFQHQRIETDLGIWGRGNAMAVTGVYQWTWNLDDITPGLNWFTGPGAQVMLGTDILNLGIVGQVGLDYRIPGVPLSASLDYRPGLFFGKNNGFDGASFALGLRYCF
jgi:hypothetical protein